MAITDITPVEVDLTGVIPADEEAAANADGSTFDWNPNTFFYVDATTTQTIITFDSIDECSQDQDHDNAVTVAIGKKSLIPVPRRFRDARGKVNVSYDQVTATAVAVIYIKAGLY